MYVPPMYTHNVLRDLGMRCNSEQLHRRGTWHRDFTTIGEHFFSFFLQRLAICLLFLSTRSVMALATIGR